VSRSDTAGAFATAAKQLSATYYWPYHSHASLVTENTLSPIIPLLERGDFATFRKVAKLWAAVLVANLIGAHIAAWVLSNTPAFKPDVQHAFQEIASASRMPSLPFRLILCWKHGAPSGSSCIGKD
jgi:hypothetical protein